MTEPLGQDSRPPSERYKEIIAMATTAVEEIEQRDKQRAKQLAYEVKLAHERLGRAVDDDILARIGAHLRWDAAVEALWNERWMIMTPPPLPDENAPERERKYFDREIDRTFQELEDAVKKRGLIHRRRV